MRSPGLAIVSEFRHQHRWALIALAGYLLVVGVIQLLVLGPGHATLDPPNGVAGVAMAPFSAVFLYFLGVFSFGLTGDLAARQSLYPARMFVLPVPTAALAGWPMLYGASAMASLWLVTGLLTRWPWGIDVPLIWPALLFAAFLAWTQVLTWMPYGLRGLRVIVAVLSLATLDAVVMLAVHYEASELLMVALLAPHLPLAFLAAWFAVARARRGEVPDWGGSSGGSDQSRLVWRAPDTRSVRPPALRRGSSGGGTADRSRGSSRSCYRSSSPCFSFPATTRRGSSSTY